MKRRALTVATSVVRVDWRRHDAQNPPGSGYVAEQGTYLARVREWRLFGVRVWRRELDREEVPLWAVAQHGATGWTDWRSRLLAQQEVTS